MERLVFVSHSGITGDAAVCGLRLCDLPGGGCHRTGHAFVAVVTGFCRPRAIGTRANAGSHWGSRACSGNYAESGEAQCDRRLSGNSE